MSRHRKPDKSICNGKEIFSRNLASYYKSMAEGVTGVEKHNYLQHAEHYIRKHNKL